MSLRFSKLTLLFVLAAAGFVSVTPAQSSSGRLSGKVVDKDGNPVAGVTVVVVNQTTTDSDTERTNSDGHYSFRLRAGAYRVSVMVPYEARFGQGKTDEYGVFSNLICDKKKERCPTLENVIIDVGERTIDFAVVDLAKDAAKPGRYRNRGGHRFRSA
jgi:hypothetical protein